MEGCFTFQWGRFVFQMGGFIFKWGAPHRGGGINFGGWGGGELKKIVRWGARPRCLPHYAMGNLVC